MVENQGKNILNNKVVIVTGGSRGIGREIVKYLAKKGYIVILNYNKSRECARNVENYIKKEGFSVDIYKADVSSREEAENLIQYTLDKYKKIDVLVNNAGIAQSKLSKSMITQKSGLIINISSIWGITGSSMEVHYSTAKAGLIGFTKALAKELGPSNIRVNAIAPGIIDTDMNKEYSKEDIEKIEEEIPLEKIGQAQNIARCVNWLIEDDYTTGEVISINGGWYM